MNPSPTVLEHTEVGDVRLSSLESAVWFSKANNLLGVFIEGDILVNTHLNVSHIQFHVTHYLILSFPCFPVPVTQKTHLRVNQTMNCTERKNIGIDFYLADLLGWMGSDRVYYRLWRPCCIFLGEGSIFDTSGERSRAASPYLGDRRGFG